MAQASCPRPSMRGMAIQMEVSIIAKRDLWRMLGVRRVGALLAVLLMLSVVSLGVAYAIWHEPYLVKDINPGGGLEIEYVANMNGTLFFRANVHLPLIVRNQ